MLGILKPKYFLFSVLLGFILSSLAGYFVSKIAGYNNFTRMFLPIMPNMFFYPTSNELLMTAKKSISRDKIVVVIGGSSILRGVGQKHDELWSKELQRLLGDDFKVINFGIDGASFASFGGVLFRILAEHYPKIIFVTTPTWNPLSSGMLDGDETYKYLFWDAYYKSLFHPDKSELRLIDSIRKNQLHDIKGLEMHILTFLDSVLYFKSLWNWIGYNFINLLWTDTTATTFFQPRCSYTEEIDGYLKRQIPEALDPKSELFRNERKAIDKLINESVDFSSKEPKIFETAIDSAYSGFNNLYPPKIRIKILSINTNYNTLHLSTFTKLEQKAYWLIIKKGDRIQKQLGYNVLVMGKDFSPTDFSDGGHLAVSGGKKIAFAVAKKVKSIAKDNGYLS